MINVKRGIISFGTLPYPILDQLLSLLGNDSADLGISDPNHFWSHSFLHFARRMKQGRPSQRRESMSLPSPDDLLFTARSQSSFPMDEYLMQSSGGIVTSDLWLLTHKHLIRLLSVIRTDPTSVRLLSWDQVIWMDQLGKNRSATVWSSWRSMVSQQQTHGPRLPGFLGFTVFYSSLSSKLMLLAGPIPTAMHQLLSGLIRESLPLTTATCSKNSD